MGPRYWVRRIPRFLQAFLRGGGTVVSIGQ